METTMLTLTTLVHVLLDIVNLSIRKPVRDDRGLYLTRTMLAIPFS